MACIWNEENWEQMCYARKCIVVSIDVRAQLAAHACVYADANEEAAGD
jgi:hypothetical protein